MEQLNIWSTETTNSIPTVHEWTQFNQQLHTLFYTGLCEVLSSGFLEWVCKSSVFQCIDPALLLYKVKGGVGGSAWGDFFSGLLMEFH